MRIKPIKLSGDIRTVIPAVSNANASIIDLGIQPLRSMVRGIHGTHRFTGGLITLLAQDRKKFGFNIRILPFPIPLNADPVDGSPQGSFLLSGNTNIIFRMTGHDTSLASGAPVQVDDHFPFIG
jgi:hypothetical protein